VKKICFQKWARFLAILAQVTLPWAKLLDGSIPIKFYWKLG